MKKTILVAITSLFLATAVQAQPTFSFSFFPGTNQYNMDWFNNQELGSLIDLGIPIEEVGSGWSFGATGLIRYPGFYVGAEYERLTGSTSYSDMSGSLEYSLPANTYSVVGILPIASDSHVLPFIGASLGALVSDADLEITILGYGGGTTSLDGSSMTIKIFGGMEFYLDPAFSFSLTAGYRAAKVNDIEMDGDAVSGSLDWSGLFARLSLNLIIDPSKPLVSEE